MFTHISPVWLQVRSVMIKLLCGYYHYSYYRPTGTSYTLTHSITLTHLSMSPSPLSLSPLLGCVGEVRKNGKEIRTVSRVLFEGWSMETYQQLF